MKKHCGTYHISRYSCVNKLSLLQIRCCSESALWRNCLPIRFPRGTLISASSATIVEIQKVQRGASRRMILWSVSLIESKLPLVTPTIYDLTRWGLNHCGLTHQYLSTINTQYRLRMHRYKYMSSLLKPVKKKGTIRVLVAKHQDYLSFYWWKKSDQNYFMEVIANLHSKFEVRYFSFPAKNANFSAVKWSRWRRGCLKSASGPLISSFHAGRAARSQRGAAMEVLVCKSFWIWNGLLRSVVPSRARGLDS